MVSKMVRMACIVVPLTILITAFIALVFYMIHSQGLFTPVPPTLNFKCGYFHDEKHIMLSDYLRNRTLSAPTPPDRSCWSIKQRRYLPLDVPAFINVRSNLLFIRVVKEDYDFIEEVSTMMYLPAHFYCYILDKNSSQEFKDRMRFLSRCIMNILVAEEEFDGSAPQEYFRSHQQCLGHLRKLPWEHAYINQELEIPVQSVQTITAHATKMKNASYIGTTRIDQTQMDNYTLIDGAMEKWINNRSEPIVLSRLFEPIFYNHILSNDTLDGIIARAPPANLNLTCRTKHKDAFGNCIFGMENYNAAARTKKLFVLADSNFDDDFIQCMHETVFKRTYSKVL